MNCKFRFPLYFCIRFKIVISINYRVQFGKYGRIASAIRYPAFGPADRGHGLPARAPDASDGGGDLRGVGVADSHAVENDGLQHVVFAGRTRRGGTHRDRPPRGAFRRGYERARPFLLFGVRRSARRIFRNTAFAARTERRSCGRLRADILPGNLCRLPERA